MAVTKESEKLRFFEKVKNKLVLFGVALIAVPLAMSLVINYQLQARNAKATLNDLNVAQVNSAKSDFSQVVVVNYGVLQATANSEPVKELLQGKGDEASVREWIAKMDATMTDGNTIIITNAAGKQILRANGELTDVSDKKYFQTVKSTHAFYGSDQEITSTGDRICTFIFPVLDDDGSFLGAVQREYKLDSFAGLVQAEVTEENEIVLIADNDGNIIAHSSLDCSGGVNQSSEKWYTESRNSLDAQGDYAEKSGGTRWRVSYAREPLTGYVMVVYRDEAVALAATNNAATFVLIIGIISLIIAILLLYLEANKLMNPITDIEGAMLSLSRGEFQKIDKYEGKKGELANIVKNTNRVIDHLEDIITSIKESSGIVGSQAGELSATSRQIGLTTDGVSGAVQGVARGATEQAETVQKASEKLADLSDDIQTVADNAENLSHTAAAMDEASQTSADAMKKLSSNMDSMRESIDEIKNAIQATGVAVNVVNEKVDMINSIASQTNLLALNASIEAARAGDAGRGFAVVAEEIGKLAADSSDTAVQIRDEMAILLRESQTAIKRTDAVSEITVNVNSVLTETVETINTLISGVEDTVSGIHSISELTEKCDASRVVIVDAMSNLSAISEENAASTEETGASVEELDATVNLLAESAGSLNEVAQRLDSDLGFFKL